MKTRVLLLLTLLQLGCSGQADKKINGVSFVASREEALQEHIEALQGVNARYAAVMPYGFMRNAEEPEIIFDTDRQWFGETRKGAKQYIEMLHSNKVGVMLKPQLWIWRGLFTGSMQMSSEEHWNELEASYQKFIVTYAELAEETGVEILCIGTELEQFVKHRPEYWTDLITRVRQVYKGKLTYAANWDEYKRTPFWGQLDYIGIDAYFPLSQEKTPSVENLRQGWQRWKKEIEELAGREERQVLFTEFGYRSVDYTAKAPWLADRSEATVNLIGQVNAKTALFDEFWGEDWFAGGFVWKWFINHKEAGGTADNRFTPQNKPAEQVIRAFYASH